MKKHLITLVAMFSILVLASCGTNNGNTREDAITNPNENPIVNENENSVVENNGFDDEPLRNESNNDSDTNKEDQDLITETGRYNGQADPHTIEIETARGPLAFQLTMEARDDIDALTEGGRVTYTYTVDGDTRTIESIQMTE